MNGAVHQVEAEATAFGNRDANFSTVIAGIWPEPKDNEATAPFSREGGYINFQSADDGDNAEKNYGATYTRLANIKKKYDPDHLFRMNPASGLIPVHVDDSRFRAWLCRDHRREPLHRAAPPPMTAAL
jgi:hypothetical protein